MEIMFHFHTMRYISILLVCFLAFTYGYNAEYQTEKIPEDYKMLVTRICSYCSHFLLPQEKIVYGVALG